MLDKEGTIFGVEKIKLSIDVSVILKKVHRKEKRGNGGMYVAYPIACSHSLFCVSTCVRQRNTKYIRGNCPRMMLQGRKCTVDIRCQYTLTEMAMPNLEACPANSWLEVCIKTCLSSRLVILLSVPTKQKTCSCTELVQSWSLSHSEHSSSPTNIVSFLGNWSFLL